MHDPNAQQEWESNEAYAYRQAYRAWSQRLRRWAEEQGYKLSPSGRIPASVIAAYEEATGDKLQTRD